MKQILFVTEECIERLRKEPEELPLPNGDSVILTYVKDEATKTTLAKQQPKRGCFVGPTLP